MRETSAVITTLSLLESNRFRNSSANALALAACAFDCDVAVVLVAIVLSVVVLSVVVLSVALASLVGRPIATLEPGVLGLATSKNATAISSQV